MGNLDLEFWHLKGTALGGNARVQIVASAEYVDAFTGTIDAARLQGLRINALASDEAVSEHMIADASLLVIEVEPGNRASMQRLGEIRAGHPDLLLVAAIKDATVSLVRTLVRQGIADVVSIPFDAEEVLQVALDAVAKNQTPRPGAIALAPMVSVVRSIGGCGATSIATHLAADLGAHDPKGRGAIIVDLDLQFGSVADYLGVQARGNLMDLLEAEDRLDEDLLRSVVGQTSDGLSVIAAPETIMPLESVDTDRLLNLIQLLRREYSYVVLDLPANWTNWTLSLAMESNAIVLVAELSIASLRQAKRRLELFQSIGIDDAAVEVVVNRLERKLFRTIDLDDVAATLGHSVLGTVSLEAPLVNTAQDQGRLASELQRKSKFATDIAGIGELLRNGRLASNR
jgi:pilus assembly protein CpaE